MVRSLLLDANLRGTLPPSYYKVYEWTPNKYLEYRPHVNPDYLPHYPSYGPQEAIASVEPEDSGPLQQLCRRLHSIEKPRRPLFGVADTLRDEQAWEARITKCGLTTKEWISYATFQGDNSQLARYLVHDLANILEVGKSSSAR
jgi:hypothetical protein